ncbi:hypothetical protein ACIPVB_12675 [Microbacterium sp. NPDC090007]|uniref:hypothetical protein n=1 Tax=Microbacterium sp. NPDC090007 TaxID=3364204 RepID=UPI00380A347D
MAGRTHIIIDTDVLAEQASTLGRVSDSLDAAASAAAAPLPSTAFGLLASGIVIGAANGLANTTAQLLSNAHELIVTMQKGVQVARESFEDVEEQAVAVMREFES